MATTTTSVPSEDEDVFIDSDDDLSFCDDDDIDSDAIRWDGMDDELEGKWTFHTHSTRGAKVFDGLSNRVGTEEFKLVYNPVDSYLLDKMNKEICSSLTS